GERTQQQIAKTIARDGTEKAGWLAEPGERGGAIVGGAAFMGGHFHGAVATRARDPIDEAFPRDYEHRFASPVGVGVSLCGWRAFAKMAGECANSAAGAEPVDYNRTPRNRSALAMTETEDSDIAAAANMGESRSPKTG